MVDVGAPAVDAKLRIGMESILVRIGIWFMFTSGVCFSRVITDIYRQEDNNDVERTFNFFVKHVAYFYSSMEHFTLIIKKQQQNPMAVP